MTIYDRERYTSAEYGARNQISDPLFLWFKQYLLSKTNVVKYNINTKHERDSETRFPYFNQSPCISLKPKLQQRQKAFAIRIHTEIWSVAIPLWYLQAKVWINKCLVFVEHQDCIKKLYKKTIYETLLTSRRK